MTTKTNKIFIDCQIKTADIHITLKSTTSVVSQLPLDPDGKTVQNFPADKWLA